EAGPSRPNRLIPRKSGLRYSLPEVSHADTSGVRGWKCPEGFADGPGERHSAAREVEPGRSRRARQNHPSGLPRDAVSRREGVAAGLASDDPADGTGSRSLLEAGGTAT